MTGQDRDLFRTARRYQLDAQGRGRLSPSMEDYLEMIGRLQADEGGARVGTLSLALQVKPSSASKMVTKLRQLGYIELDRGDCILPTETGREYADFLLKRHALCERLLRLLGSAAPLVEAELLEHALSPETLVRLELLLDFLAREEVREALAGHLAQAEEDECAPSSG